MLSFYKYSSGIWVVLKFSSVTFNKSKYLRRDEARKETMVFSIQM